MKNVPKLRFKGFSDEWEEKKVESIFDKIRNPVDVQEEREYKQIGIRSHGKGIFYKESVTGKELGNKRVFWVEPNVFIVNIVFAWERAVARTTDKEVGMIASHRFPMYKPKKQILDLDFITHLFITKKGQSLLELASPGGAGRNKTLGQKEFDNLVVKLPSLQEQQKISNFIIKVDKFIEKQNEKVENLEIYKKGMMQKLFSQKIRFKSNNGEEYPKWLLKKISECIIKGKAGGTPKSTVNRYYNGDIKFLSISDMTLQGKYIMSTEKTITREGLDNSSAWIVPSNSIIYSMYASVGFASINKVELATSQAMFSMIINNDNNTEYIYYFLNYFKENGIKKFIEKGTQANLNADTIKNIVVPIPILKEQNKIAYFLSKIDNILEKEKQKLEALREWKNGLLQQMFV